ncbi:MAG: integrase core domain-containing protein [Woeseiaceae bacterium]|nr:integrase core domain-containing protein [Woeseiaceae bacterium]
MQPDTVVSWHRKGWKAYWRWRSQRTSRTGRKKVEPELRELIRRMARENPLWGQRRIQAELARLGFEACAWLAQQMIEACGISRATPRYLIHDRDGCFGTLFNRRVSSLGARQIRTPVKAPKANACAERWVRTIRNECLDHRPLFGHEHLQRTVDEFVAYYNRWRPHRSLGQMAPCPHVMEVSRKPARPVISRPVLGGLHHVYQWAA